MQNKSFLTRRTFIRVVIIIPSFLGQPSTLAAQTNHSCDTKTSIPPPVQIFTTCASALGYTLNIPLVCHVISTAKVDYRVKVTSCVGASVYATGLWLNCACAICKTSQKLCKGC